MTLSNWKFALFYGVFFTFTGSYQVTIRHGLGIVFGAVQLAVGVVALGMSFRTWRRERIRERAQPPG